MNSEVNKSSHSICKVSYDFWVSGLLGLQATLVSKCKKVKYITTVVCSVFLYFINYIIQINRVRRTFGIGSSWFYETKKKAKVDNSWKGKRSTNFLLPPKKETKRAGCRHMLNTNWNSRIFFITVKVIIMKVSIRLHKL